jgi:hypothetical protein
MRLQRWQSLGIMTVMLRRPLTNITGMRCTERPGWLSRNMRTIRKLIHMPVTAAWRMT